MTVWAIARANVIRMLRDRSNIFFVFIFPLALVLLIGAQFGGSSTPRLGVFDQSDSELSAAIIDDLSRDLEIQPYDSLDQLTLAAERGSIAAGLEIPGEMESVIRQGDSVTLGFVTAPNSGGAQIQALVTETVARSTSAAAVGQFVVKQGLADFEDGVRAADSLTDLVSEIGVDTRTTGEALFPASLGQFDIGASSQLLLFMFLTGLAGSAVLIQTRQLGLSTRMLSTPNPVRSIVLGEALGRFGVVMVQGIYIMGATLLLFRVNWGDPVGAIAILVVFSAVAAGAAVLVGAVLSNDAQAAGVGVIGGLGLAALGGSMLPIELFSPTMARIARFTPHAWANDAFAELVRHGATVAEIAPQLGVLALMAVVLLGLASWRLRSVITRGA